MYDGTTKVESFNIDLSGDTILNAAPDRVEVPRGDSAVLSGYPDRISVRLYQIENQIADKLCALSTATTADPQPATTTCTPWPPSLTSSPSIRTGSPPLSASSSRCGA